MEYLEKVFILFFCHGKNDIYVFYRDVVSNKCEVEGRGCNDFFLQSKKCGVLFSLEIF